MKNIKFLLLFFATTMIAQQQAMALQIQSKFAKSSGNTFVVNHDGDKCDGSCKDSDSDED